MRGWNKARGSQGLPNDDPNRTGTHQAQWEALPADAMPIGVIRLEPTCLHGYISSVCAKDQDQGPNPRKTFGDGIHVSGSMSLKTRSVTAAPDGTDVMEAPPESTVRHIINDHHVHTSAPKLATSPRRKESGMQHHQYKRAAHGSVATTAKDPSERWMMYLRREASRSHFHVKSRCRRCKHCLPSRKAR